MYAAHLSSDIYKIFVRVIDECNAAHQSKDIYQIFVCVIGVM
jgi:hypothetical protein